MEKGQCSQIKQRCLLSPLPFNIVQDVLALVITQETKKTYSWEGIRKSLFADNKILYVKSPKEQQKKSTKTNESLTRLQDTRSIYKNNSISLQQQPKNSKLELKKYIYTIT